jgi:hypothetical protein
MADELPTWERPYFSEPAGKPLLLYYVLGDFPRGLAPSRSKHRVSGVPAGVEIAGLAANDPSLAPFFEEGPFADGLARRPNLAEAVRSAPACLRIYGEIADAPTLDYLRDAIGLVAAALDAGGVGVLDPQSLSWWSPEEFRERFFDHGEARILPHVAFLGSNDDDGVWLHTRGMRKFGRPDVSVRGVAPEHQDAVFELVQRLVQSMALGAVVPDGQPIKMASLPAGMSCHHAGSLDDPDFNNVHIEVRRPA